MHVMAKKGCFQLASSISMALLQIVQIAVIARVFEGRTLGIVTLDTMIVAIVTVFCDFGLQSYVVQDRRRIESTTADVACALPVFAAGGVAVCAGAACIATFAAGAPDVGHALWWMLPAVPLAVVMGPLQGFAIRELHLERLALAEAAGKGAGAAVTIALAAGGRVADCVIAGFYVALVVKLAGLRHDARRLLPFIVRTRMRARRRGRRAATVSYALAQVLGQIANVLAAKADEMIVAATMPLAVFGIYASLKQLVVQSVAFVSPIVRRMTMPLFAMQRRGTRAAGWTTGQVIGWSNAAYVAFFLALALNAELVTRLLYGHAFAAHAQWLAWFAVVWSLRTFAGATTSALLQSTGAPLTDLTWTALQAAMQTLVLLATASHGIAFMLLSAALAHATLGIAGHLMLVAGRAGVSRRQAAVRWLLPAAAYYTMAAALWFVERRAGGGWAGPPFAVLLASAIAMLAAWSTGRVRPLLNVEAT